jgi:FlaG/FlaF family flagellin (archaellin)
MISDKKAVSGVIVTVLLILLVIAAISIVALVVLPFIQEGLEEGTRGVAGCIETDLKIVSATVSVDAVSDAVIGSVIVKRTAGSVTLEDIALFGGADDESAQIGSAGTEADIGIGETVNFEVDDIETISAGDTLKVYAVINGRQCDAADTFEVPA